MSGSAGNLAASIPVPSAPLVDDHGMINPPWRAWLLIIQRRTGGTVGASVDEETADRIAADTVLRTAINAEALVRADADASLHTFWATEVALRISGDTAEANARAVADSQLLPLNGSRPMTGPLVAPEVHLGGGPTWSAGVGVPVGVQPRGSLYSRTGGAVGTTLYVSQGGGTWNPIPGV